ncbi:hypothetical protein ACEPAF_1518 [Sanghuangporus sanghuang]|uniref:Hydrophobin n=1 Tax=Sanghuangporus baumii TaxID=108892 RepID=A0A9Q5N6Z4_SANBA|nr:fungal hydrophobin [Sanghuangporus baumii]
MLFTFTKYASVLALPLLTVATPGGTPTIKAYSTTTVTVTSTTTATQPASQCNTGPIQCCNSVQPATSPECMALLGLLGIALQDVNDLMMGVTCRPLSNMGSGGSGCEANPVCCENNNFNGMISIGCVPVNIEM